MLWYRSLRLGIPLPANHMETKSNGEIMNRPDFVDVDKFSYDIGSSLILLQVKESFTFNQCNNHNDLDS